MKIGLDVLLTMILAILKLSGAIHISWWLVFLPMIAGTAITLALLLFVGVIAMRMKNVVIKNGGKVQ